MEISPAQIDHFHRQGFFLIANPLAPSLGQIDQLQQRVEGEWEKRDWPPQFNKSACQFLLMGEVLLQLVERPELVELARRLLDCDQVHVGACGLGDASKIIAEDGRPRRQVHWHADGDPDVKQVSLRTGLDRHDPTNAPLRVLPGSHLRPRPEVEEELRQLELASGQHDQAPTEYFARHPHEVEVRLDPRWTLVWSPSMWHATGVKTAAGPRRALAWNYFPSGGRNRDREALKYLFADEWQGWSLERRRLWGLD
ncbi:MAG: hypothetical protein GKR89_08875 [Candidatus Latescibacteria bacterium]|nr:hypothetical protein [Candidatus Latescibacterota bacterium]